jgi:hypothetical protein
MADVERDVIESENGAIAYLDLLGFAAVVEAYPTYSVAEPADHPSLQNWPSSLALQRLSLFNHVLESNISSEQPNHAMEFSDCAFWGLLYAHGVWELCCCPHATVSGRKSSGTNGSQLWNVPSYGDDYISAHN